MKIKFIEEWAERNYYGYDYVMRWIRLLLALIITTTCLVILLLS
jgi:hypothetical protein